MDLGSALEEAQVDAAAAPWRFHDEGVDLFAEAETANTVHLLADVWVYDPSLAHVLLVQHRRRGWVMPGGKVEAGESVRDGAVRELREETAVDVGAEALAPVGLRGRLEPEVGAVVLALSYSISIDPGTVSLRGEPGCPVRWWPLQQAWDSVYAHDRGRMLDHATWLRRRGELMT